MATLQEKVEVERMTRADCARIAALESHYWAIVEGDEPSLMQIAIGAIGAAANICAAILTDKSPAEFQVEIEQRGGTPLRNVLATIQAHPHELDLVNATLALLMLMMKYPPNPERLAAERRDRGVFQPEKP
jgi:hypothetical protein